MPLVKSVMTPFPHSVDIDDDLATAGRLLARHAVRHLPVTENGRVVSVLSERDLRGSAHEAPAALTVRDVCTPDVYTVELGQRLDLVLEDMARRRIGCAVVVKEGRLAGIFTTTDACHRFAEFLRRQFSTGGDEAA